MSETPAIRQPYAVTFRRIARRQRRCDCGRVIRPGDAYLAHVAFPGHDANERGSWVDRYGLPAPDRPRRADECARCAIRYGRTEVNPPYEQCAREGLL